MKELAVEALAHGSMYMVGWLYVGGCIFILLPLKLIWVFVLPCSGVVFPGLMPFGSFLGMTALGGMV